MSLRSVGRSFGKSAPAATSNMSAVVLCLLLALAVGAAGCGGGDDEKTEEVPRTALVPGALDDTLHTSADTTAWKQMGGTGGDDARLLPGEGVTGDRGQPSGDGPEPEGEMTATTRPPDSSDGPPSLSSSAGGSGAYLLQLGSFSNLENARKQADRLRDNGYDPVLETSTLGGQTYHRVVLRGLPDKSAASALGERIHAELGITYLVRQNR